MAAKSAAAGAADAETRACVRADAGTRACVRADAGTRACVRADAGTRACVRADAALARAFEVLGKRWTGVLLGSLRDGPAGFRELSRAVGKVSDSVLSERLCALAKAGLVTRTVEEGPPVAVNYQLTERGRALVPALEQLSRWAREHLPEGG